MEPQTFYTIVAIASLIIALSFIVQMAMFIFIYSAIKKLTGVAESVQTKVEPVIDQARPVITQVQETILNVKGVVDKINVQAKDTFDKVSVETRAIAAAVSTTSQEITSLVHHQAEQISSTLDLTTSTLQRQVIELDELLTRTQDRIEYTTLEVQTTVIQPIREVSALLVGIRRTIEALVGRDRKQINQAYQDEEMFI